MKRAGIDRRKRGERWAALLAAALLLAGCSLASTPPSTADTANTASISRFSSLFSGSASPAAQAATAGAPGFNADDCPDVEIRNGAGSLTVAGTPPSPTGVRYQLTLTQFARQCTAIGADVMMKVGVQGRIIVGPIGGPGQVDIPLRYAVVRGGAEPKTIATKFKRFPADVQPGQSNVVFADVEENLSFPMPSRAELAGYLVYVGFDEVGEAPEKKPVAKRPVVKRQ